MQRNEVGETPAEVLRTRIRRLAEGGPFEDLPTEDFNADRGRPLSVADILRMAWGSAPSVIGAGTRGVEPLGLTVNCVLTNTMGMVVPGHCQESLNDEKSVGPLAVGRSRRVDCAGHVVQVL